MPNVKLDRATLAKFLPDEPSIRAFEKILEYVTATTPDQIEEIFLVLNSIKRVNTGEINRRLASIEEAPQPARVNLSSILDRLEALEVAERRRDNLAPLLTRLDNLEQFIGV